MSYQGDAAEQVLRISLEAFEIAMKLSGSAIKNLAAGLLAYSQTHKNEPTKLKSYGKETLDNMVKSEGKPSYYPIKNEDLKEFRKKAIKFGITYCETINHEGHTYIRVHDSDCVSMNELYHIMGYDTVNVIESEKDKESELNQKESGDDTLFNQLYPNSEKQDFSEEHTEIDFYENEIENDNIQRESDTDKLFNQLYPNEGKEQTTKEDIETAITTESEAQKNSQNTKNFQPELSSDEKKSINATQNMSNQNTKVKKDLPSENFLNNNGKSKRNSSIEKSSVIEQLKKNKESLNKRNKKKKTRNKSKSKSKG